MKERILKIGRMQNQVLLAKAKLQSLTAALELLVAETINEQNGSIKDDSLCLQCGGVHPSGLKCQKCE